MYSTSWGGIYLGHKGNGYIFSAIYLFIELIVCFYRVNNAGIDKKIYICLCWVFLRNKLENMRDVFCFLRFQFV